MCRINPFWCDRAHWAGAHTRIALSGTGCGCRNFYARHTCACSKCIKRETRAECADAQKPVFSGNANTVCKGKRTCGDGSNFAGNAGSAERLHELLRGKVAALACKVVGAQTLPGWERRICVNQKQDTACARISSRHIKPQGCAHAETRSPGMPSIQPEWL